MPHQRLIPESLLSKILGHGKEQIDDRALIQDIDPIALRNTIKVFYGIDYLTFSRMKRILKEGAKYNQILWLQDEAFN